MADILIDTETTPATPSNGRVVIFADSSTNKLAIVDSSGNVLGRLSRNFATVSQGAGFAADTYVTNSGLAVPSNGVQAGMVFRWVITGSKTAAGVAAPVYTIRGGTIQGTSDSALLAFTTAAQTAVADNGVLTVTAVLRVAGASAVLAGAVGWAKTQTGLIGFGGSIDAVSSPFNSAALSAGNFIGLSINGGASAAWTLTSVHAELLA